MRILDFYRSRFGQAVKHQGNGWNGPCPLCGGEPGKSDRFMVWPDRSDNLGEVCAKHGITGIWSCRQCGKSGDTIAYLMKIDGMDFKSALGELGIEGEKRPYRRRRAPEEPKNEKSAIWVPKPFSMPSAAWQERAGKLVEKAEKSIWDFPNVMSWLAARGICENAVRQYRIGYLDEESAKYHGLFRPRAAFGLPDKIGQDGKKHDKLFIPRGILIPSFAVSGEILNLRIRRHKTDLGERSPKYLELEGSSNAPLFLVSSLPQKLAVYFITEAELDAMLIHHVTDGKVGAIAVRTNRGKPDARCHSALSAAVRICIALDYDKAGADGVDFWENSYPRATRWPTPEGKDPGDAFALGVNIRDWIVASLPASVSLPEAAAELHGSSLSQNISENQPVGENGPVDMLPSGQKNLGEGAKLNPENKSGSWPSENRARVNARAMSEDWRKERSQWQDTQPEPFVWASRDDFTQAELALLTGAIFGGDIEGVYLDVAVIWLAWRNLPVAFFKLRDETGALSGFRWDYNYDWAAKNEKKLDFFWRHVETSRAFWQWLWDHPADRINAGNLLRLWELLAQKLGK